MGCKTWVAVTVACACLTGLVSCGDTGTSAPPEAPDAVKATVEVDGFGFSLSPNTGELGYGVVLANTSAADALNLGIAVNFIDAAGTVVLTETGVLTGLPAGSTFYWGGTGHPENGELPERMEVFVEVGGGEAATSEPLTATQVRVVDNEMVGTTVLAQVRNDYPSTLSSRAYIGCVLFDASGAVIGGGYTLPDTDIPSGRTVAVEIASGVQNTPVEQVAEARVSVEYEVLPE